LLNPAPTVGLPDRNGYLFFSFDNWSRLPRKASSRCRSR